jgi:hypothetical protein
MPWHKRARTAVFGRKRLRSGNAGTARPNRACTLVALRERGVPALVALAARNSNLQREDRMTTTIQISDTVAGLLAVLGPTAEPFDIRVRNVVEALIDHAQQGVYRPGAWERSWLMQAFGDDWTALLEPGDPHGRAGCEHIFIRPMRR